MSAAVAGINPAPEPPWTLNRRPTQAFLLAASRFPTRRSQRFLGGAGGAECGDTLTMEFRRQRMFLQFSRDCRPDAVRSNGDSGVWARRQTAPERCGYP